MLSVDMSCRVECAAWCAEGSQPFSIVNDQAFRNLLLNGNPERKLPQPRQILLDVRAIVEKAQEYLRDELKVSK